MCFVFCLELYRSLNQLVKKSSTNLQIKNLKNLNTLFALIFDLLLFIMHYSYWSLSLFKISALLKKKVSYYFETTVHF
jgi:hypothetical protein